MSNYPVALPTARWVDDYTQAHPLPSFPLPYPAGSLGLDKRHIFHRETPRAVGAVAIYSKDARIFRGLTHRQSRHSGGGIRGKVSKLTRESRKRMMFAFRNMPTPKIMIGLTYPGDFPTDGLKVKRDLDVFLKFLKRRKINYAWFLEFQQRGAAHFHIFVDAFVPYQLVAETWYRIVGSGDPAHIIHGTSVQWLRKPGAAGAYATKYASKNEQKEVPPEFQNVGRFWGMCRKLIPRPVLHFAGLGVNERVDTLTGEVITGESIYTYIRILRKLFNARRRKLGLKRWRDKGYYGAILWGCGSSASA